MDLKIAVAQERLDQILARVRDYRWYEGCEGWRYGTDVNFLKKLAEYWTDEYDWRATEQRINAFRNFTTEIDGLNLHYLVEKGSGRAPLPLLIIHGWPYSILSYLGVIERLAHPERFGGNADDGFDVILASLPGTGFSQSPTKPMGLRSVAPLFHQLMTDVLGYERYVLDGGDQGAAVASYMALDHPEHVIGLHHSFIFPRHATSPMGSGQVGPGATDRETAYVLAETQRFRMGGAYVQLQRMSPETLAPAMADSPIGLASWIVDKYHAWTDQRHRPFEDVVTSNQLIDEIMLYLVTDSFRTSLWAYAAAQTEATSLAENEKITVPTGVAAWPDPWNPIPPREFVERSRGNIIFWREMDEGGHFPFIEQPEKYVANLVDFSRLLPRAA